MSRKVRSICLPRLHFKMLIVLGHSSLRTADVFPVVASLPPKIASAISSCETISVTSFLFFCPQPIKLSDRKIRSITRAKSRGPPTVDAVLSAETLKRFPRPKETRFFCSRLKFQSEGESEDLLRELGIRALIYNSVGVDFSIYPFVCLRRLQ